VSPSWYSQPFPPDGGITAEGLRNQLGRPSLSLATVLVRETAQNSWDARVRDLVKFRLDLGEIGPSRINAWRDLLREGMPTSDDDFPLRRLLRGSAFRYLAVSDRGTSGLGGPTRSDVPAPPGERDWLSFVLNSGEARDTDGGGGTYGYGKGVFYLAASGGTVIIYTRFAEGGRLRTRLIGSVLWKSFVRNGVPYTGRHFWGRQQQAFCEPLEDREAEEAAARLHLPQFEADDTGTTVVVLDPAFPDPNVPEEDAGPMTPEQAATYLAEAAGWNLWPLMLADRRERMQIDVTLDQVPIPVPSPADDAILAAFAKAHRKMRSEDGKDVLCMRPKKLLGRFGAEATFGASTTSYAALELGIDGAPHHTAVMRRPDLVVRYVPGPETMNPSVGYAAVMKAADDLDDVYAEAEPPTHDAWIDSQLHGERATFVRVTHRRLRELMDELSGPRRVPATVEQRPVGGLSRRLGHLLSGVVPHGGGSAMSGLTVTAAPLLPGGRSPSGGGRGGAGGSGAGTAGGGAGVAARPGTVPRARLDGPARHVRDSELGAVIEQTVRLSAEGTYEAVARVLTGDGRAETDPYVGASAPEILGWRTGENFVTGSTLSVGASGVVEVVVRPVPDALLEISVGALT
jgi:hypothetical protein